MSITPIYYRSSHTDKKENNIFLLYKEVQIKSDAKKSNMRKGFLIYEEMRKYLTIYPLVIYDFAPDPF